jgi:hypothetical protein
MTWNADETLANLYVNHVGADPDAHWDLINSSVKDIEMTFSPEA